MPVEGVKVKKIREDDHAYHKGGWRLWRIRSGHFPRRGQAASATDGCGHARLSCADMQSQWGHVL